MSRNLSTNLKSASQSRYLNMLIFVKLELDSGTIYLHNGIGTYNFDSNNYLGVGDFGSIDTVEESTGLSPYSLTLILSGLDSDLLDEVQNQDYYLRPVTVFVGALNENMSLSATPDVLFSGFMDSADVSLGEENAIRLKCESDLSIFDKSNNSRFSDADLQREFPGDLFLQYAEEMVDATIIWRGTAQRNTGSINVYQDDYDYGDYYDF